MDTVTLKRRRDERRQVACMGRQRALPRGVADADHRYPPNLVLAAVAKRIRYAVGP